LIVRVLRNAASLTGAQLAMKLAGLAVTILVARALHADGFGRFAAAWSFGMLVGVLADGGLAYFVALEVSRARRTARRFVWTALTLRAALCLLGILIAAAALPLLHFSGPLAAAALVFALSAVLDGLCAQILAYYRAVARMHVEASVVTFGRVALIAASAMALVHPSVLAFALAQCAASAATAAVALRLLGAEVPPIRPRRRALRAIAFGTLPFTANGLLTYVFFRIDTLLLRGFGIPDAAIGAYSAAYRVMEAPRTAFASTIAAGALPAATSLAHPSQRASFLRLGRTTTGLVLWIMAPAALVFALAPGLVIGLIFGRGFTDAATLLLVLSPMPILMGLDAILGTFLNALSLQKTVTAVFALCALVNVTLNVIMIPRSGALGAAIATVLTEAVELSAFALVVWRRLDVLQPVLA
jgi:O-antigen/teichoic acid export membrane protein